MKKYIKENPLHCYDSWANGSGGGTDFMDWMFGENSLIGNIMGTAQAQKSANKEMEFQERMSSSAHQREVEDMKKAGLNPMLSAMGGGGSSTPSGASASGATMDIPAGISKGVSTALEASKFKKEIEEIQSRINNTNASASGTIARTAKERSTQGIFDWIGEKIGGFKTGADSLIGKIKDSIKSNNKESDDQNKRALEWNKKVNDAIANTAKSIAETMNPANNWPFKSNKK